MSILLLLSLLQLQAASALPVLQPTSSDSPTQVDSNSNDSTRSTSDIFWSCIATIFACTWVAVHPNIPSPRDSDRQLFWRRVKILAVALIAPEFIIIWALNQLRSALYSLKKLRKFDACKHWTVTHGMFLVMGGFVLNDRSEERLEILRVDTLETLLSGGEVTLPHIAESEIMDKSKGDALAKTLVLIQTTWFIAQVISRVVLHLPITELELTTVAFALLNFLTYALWWKKPLDVRYRIVVSWRNSSGHTAALELTPAHSYTNILPGANLPEETEDDAAHRPNSTASRVGFGQTRLSLEGLPLQESFDDSNSTITEVDITDAKKRSYDQGSFKFVRLNGSASLNLSSAHKPPLRSSVAISWLGTVSRSLSTSLYTLYTTANRLFTVIPSLVRSLGAAYKKVCSGFLSPMSLLSRKDETHVDKVPIFYSGGLGNLYNPAGITDNHWARTAWLWRMIAPVVLEMFIGTLFGSVHCAAWEFTFPSKLEQTLWRIMSLCITVIPMIIAIAIVIRTATTLLLWKSNRQFILFGIKRLMFPLYILARLIVLVMAFVLLRDLPDAAFEVVQWTTFIPHI
ncbi:hypothetical protein D9757_013527 [Collybiopsis confluens]|uniref:Uncharacterized protein n=1 Tax=Collybiopsis confluens TaxID=2823264 RepID=A0A8H5G1D7_9AGAR|nr:hypothetical protein D9757_013527 [Collybiopsis confluens]